MLMARSRLCQETPEFPSFPSHLFSLFFISTIVPLFHAILSIPVKNVPNPVNRVFLGLKDGVLSDRRRVDTEKWETRVPGPLALGNAVKRSGS